MAGPAGARLAVRLTPRAGADAIDAVDAGEVRARVRAAPVEGAANEALLRLLADRLNVARSTLRLVSGASGRRKIVEIAGLTSEEVRARLAVSGRAPGSASDGTRHTRPAPR